MYCNIQQEKLTNRCTRDVRKMGNFKCRLGPPSPLPTQPCQPARHSTHSPGRNKRGQGRPTS